MRETDSQPFDEATAFNVLKTICFAMILGVLGTGTVLAITNGPPQSTTLNLFPSGFGIIITVVSVTVAMVVFRHPIQQWKKPVPPDQLPKTKEEEAFGEWMGTELIRFALLEGSALVNTILSIFMDQHGNVINLACAGVSLALMAGVFFPSRFAWEEYRNNRVAQLDAEGWQPPQSPDPVA